MPKATDFQDLLTDIDDGKLHTQLTELWPRVVKAVRETNKPGSLTITLNAKLDRGTMVVVTPKVSTKMPAPATGASIFYSDEEGNLSKHDPKQLPLKNVTPIGGGKPQA